MGSKLNLPFAREIEADTAGFPRENAGIGENPFVSMLKVAFATSLDLVLSGDSAQNIIPVNNIKSNKRDDLIESLNC